MRTPFCVILILHFTLFGWISLWYKFGVTKGPVPKVWKHVANRSCLGCNEEESTENERERERETDTHNGTLTLCNNPYFYDKWKAKYSSKKDNESMWSI